jgi:hypothetical protein
VASAHSMMLGGVALSAASRYALQNRIKARGQSVNKREQESSKREQSVSKREQESSKRESEKREREIKEERPSAALLSAAPWSCRELDGGRGQRRQQQAQSW